MNRTFFGDVLTHSLECQGLRRSSWNCEFNPFRSKRIGVFGLQFRGSDTQCTEVS